MIQADTHTESIRGQLGQGILSLSELKLFVAFHAGQSAADKVPIWLKHALNPIGHVTRRPDYSFSDLISLIVVSELRKRGMKSWRIREAELYLRKLTDVDRPFVTETIATDGVTVWIPSQEPGQMESANEGGGQQVQIKALGNSLKRIQYREGKAKSWSPSKGVVIDPDVQFGRPVIEGTRVLAEEAADVARDAGEESAQSWLALSAAELRNALKFQREAEILSI